ncbi:hypothetical protein Ahy_A04g021143 [Arachis hypogaea]|uniref:PB1 domain-containing protein n=1 Tax=Arachis hypogaea TaxID=3818 RepID=A0A445DJH8_ARAHY|nr:hypothetical protein Ahy_A04g021143 [Arachis hypogaea]
MFGLEGELEDPFRSGWQLKFVDRENDVLLLGDGPWPSAANGQLRPGALELGSGPKAYLRRLWELRLKKFKHGRDNNGGIIRLLNQSY